MGKKGKRGGQQKTRTTISLFEFNQDVSVGQDPALASLPTAPKLDEEWAAEGGRPEYNSRGYKERRVDPYASDRRADADADFDTRDWTRRGPVDDDSSSFGRGPERDWGARRVGPLDASGAAGAAGGPTPERDFAAVRRGPVEADFGGSGGSAREVDFGVRRGPVDAEFSSGGAGRDVDFGVRRGPIEAEFGGGASGARQVDFGVRRGPVDAEFANTARDVDFGVRKGPIEAEFSSNTTPTKQVDFGVRRGPIEADFGNKSDERDFSVRKGPLDAQPSSAAAPAHNRHVDFGSVRRAPVDAHRPARPNEGARDFAHMRRTPRTASEAESGTRSWRRRSTESGDAVAAGMARLNVNGGGAGGGNWNRRGDSGESAPLRRDWRRSAGHADADDLAAARSTVPPPRAEKSVANGVEITTDPNSEWTTVRTLDRRRGPMRRPATSPKP